MPNLIKKFFKKKATNLDFSVTAESTTPKSAPESSSWSDVASWASKSVWEGLNYLYSKASDIFYPPEDIMPTTEPELSIWIQRQREKLNEEQFQKRLDQRNKRLSEMNKSDLKKVDWKLDTCRNWEKNVKENLKAQFNAEKNIYIRPENRQNPELVEEWEGTPVDHDSFKKRLCDDLGCPQVEEPRNSLALPQSIEPTCLDQAASRNIAEQKLDTCRQDFKKLDNDYNNLKNELFASKLINESYEKILKDQSQSLEGSVGGAASEPRSSNNRPHASNTGSIMLERIKRQGEPVGFTPEADKLDTMASGFVRLIFGLFDLPMKITSGRFYPVESGLNGLIQKLFNVILALFLIACYMSVLAIFFYGLYVLINFTLDRLQTRAKNKQEEYEYKRDKARKEANHRLKESNRRRFGRTLKNVAHEGAEIAHKWTMPFRAITGKEGSDSRDSVKSIRGGYIPPIPDSTLFDPQTYVGLTEFEKQQILFAHDPIHLMFRLQELRKEAEHILLKIEQYPQTVRKSKRVRIKNACGASINFIKSKRPLIDTTKIKTQVSATLGYLTLVMSAILGTCPPMASLGGDQVQGYSHHSSFQRDKSTEELISSASKIKEAVRTEEAIQENADAVRKLVSASEGDHIVEKLMSNSRKLTKNLFSGQSIQKNAAIEQLLTNVEESEELAVTENLGSKKRSSKNKKKKFNRRTFTLADLTDKNGQGNTPETVEEYLSQPTKIKPIKIR